tara:strand:+ start:386 stop:1264 length:879 start_codon:yes stop_codon:yes gene_type:complete
MDEMDLNVENYSLNDLLNLFKLTPDFTISDLKNAKKIVYKTHPDKSKLPKEVFIFFVKAYKYVHNIYEFKKRTNNNETEYENVVEYSDKEKKNIINNINKNNIEFNTWFNEMFDKYSLNDSENGYEEWLKQENTSIVKAENISQLHGEFNKYKQSVIKDLVVHKEIQDVCNTLSYGGSNINRKNISDYSSNNIFDSSLSYNDVKKAHTETFIPVTDEDFKAKKKYNNIFELNNERTSQQFTLPSMEQSNEYIRQKQSIENNIANKDAYEMLKKQEEQEKMNNLFWKNLRLLN